MDEAQIKHLGTLSRIKLTEDEIAALASEIGAILEYVSVIDEVVPQGELKKEVGPVHNVFREDEVTNEPGSFTQELLQEMPETDGPYLKVKKILDQND